METKTKIIKTAKVCTIVSKVLYLLSCAVCLTFIILAIVLPLTNTLIPDQTKPETAMTFTTLALYTFVLIGLLWNVEGVFKTIAAEQSPFTDRVSHYLKKVAIYSVVLSLVPALLGSIILKLVSPESELTFPIHFSGIVAGAVLFLVGLFFSYGKELQNKDDETL